MLNKLVGLREKNSMHNKLGVRIFFFALFLYISANFIDGTTYRYVFDTIYVQYIRYIAEFLVIFKIVLFTKIRLKDAIIVTLVSVIFLSSSINSGNYEYVYYVLFIIAAKDIKFEEIIKVFVITISVLLLLTFGLAKLGVLPGVVSTRPDVPTLRYSLGTIYATDLAARIFYVWLAYVMLRKFKLIVPEYIVGASLCMFIYIVTDTKVDTLLVMLTLIISMMNKRIMQLLSKIKSKYIATSILVVIGGMIILSYFYSSSSGIFTLLDKLLNGRLRYGNMAFSRYNVTMFGQYIAEVGAGGFHKSLANYFFIDSSYERILMFAGLIPFAIVVIGILKLSKKLMLEKLYVLEIGLLLILLGSIIDHHLFELSNNIIFLALLSNTSYFVDNFTNNRKTC